jgi:hypothetical protein
MSLEDTQQRQKIQTYTIKKVGTIIWNDGNGLKATKTDT